MIDDALTSPKKLVSYFLKPYRLFFVGLVICLTFSVICSELIPWYTAQLINLINLINSNVEKSSSYLTFISLFQELVFLTIAAIVLESFIHILLQYKCLSPVGISIRHQLFDLIIKKHHNFWHTHAVGDVWEKIDLTRRTIAAFSSLGVLLFDVYAVLCSMVIILYFLFKIYPPLMFVFIISSFVTMIVFNVISENIKKTSSQLTKFQTATFGKIVNLISNFFILKSFGSEKREQAHLEKDLNHLSKAMKKHNWTYDKNQFVLKMLILVFQCGIMIYAIYLWTSSKINVGDIVFVVTSASAFSRKLDSFGWVIPFFKSRSAILKKNIQVFNAENPIKDNLYAHNLTVKQGQIDIKNLNFAYNEHLPIIKNLSLSIRAKEKIGIVGVSGGGKTTLLHLLQRLIDTPKNSIFIDGQDITTVTQESLHNAIAFIPQDTSLFHRTILENLKYSQQKANFNDVSSSAQKAYADIFINSFPKKYKTLVGDKGVKLSGGERQRIGIARALLKNSPILLLDEATSALDSQSETFIQKAIQTVIQNKTVIIVAHRLSTLKNMDRIIVLDKGEIIEQGTPQQLLDKKGKFAQLWNLQSC